MTPHRHTSLRRASQHYQNHCELSHRKTTFTVRQIRTISERRQSVSADYGINFGLSHFLALRKERDSEEKHAYDGYALNSMMSALRIYKR